MAKKKKNNADKAADRLRLERDKQANTPLLPSPELPILQPIKMTTNTIAFSSDKNFLYLIDGGRVLAFDLTQDGGVIVGSLKGQITAASGREKFPIKVDKRKQTKYELDLTDSSYCLDYNSENDALFLIGASDIDGGLNGDTKIVPSIRVFLLKKNVLRIQNAGDKLTLLYGKG